jgi:hypothetical protein
MDVIGNALRGIYRDRLIGPDDDLLYDSGWIANTVVTRCRILLAALIKNEVEGGIHHLAVGRGEESWDDEGVEPAPQSTSELINPYPGQVLPSDANDTRLELDFLEGDEVTLTPTTCLQIRATLAPGFPESISPGAGIYPLREFGIFGGPEDGAYMINCVRHPVIDKHVSATLIREIRLYF